MLRPAYAVEYDYLPAHQCSASLETKRYEGLFFAGQLNGTTGERGAAVVGIRGWEGAPWRAGRAATRSRPLAVQGRQVCLTHRSFGSASVRVPPLIPCNGAFSDPSLRSTPHPTLRSPLPPS